MSYSFDNFLERLNIASISCYSFAEKWVLDDLPENFSFDLEKYDAGYWSIYDLLRKYPSTKSYHSLHVRQLKILHKLTGEKIFLDYAKIWEKYMNKWINKKHANINRGLLHLKRYGIRDSMKRYIDRKKWQKEQSGGN